MAIDKHTIPRYDKTYNMLNIITSKFKNGTYHFNCLATINCTMEGSRAFLGATLIRRMDSLSDTVSKLIDGCTKKGIRIGMLTVDREFFSTAVIGTLRSKNVQFLMPATKTKGIKKATSEFEAGKTDAVSQHVLTSSVAGKEPEKFTLIILKREDKKGRKVIHAFATSIPVDVVCGFKRDQMTGAEAFVEQYRARWSIETGYRCVESMRPRNHQQGRVRTRAAAICTDHFVQRMDTGIASAAKRQPWQSPDRDDVQDAAGILHAACPGKDMPVFVSAVAFAVAASEIAAVYI